MKLAQVSEVSLKAPRSNLGHDLSRDRKAASECVAVALLTGGADKPYALGLASALMVEEIFLDFVGSDEVDGPQLHGTRQVNFLNLRGDQRINAGRWAKLLRVLRYYARLLWYAARAEPRVFHILWNNKFEVFDRTILMLYYRMLGKRIVFTAHNVNAGKRDLNDSWINRVTLRIQYLLADHIFVHSEGMKTELVGEFKIRSAKVSVIPFGINNTLPNTGLSVAEARQGLGLADGEKTLLFFGNIAPYKGLSDLISALALLKREGEDYRLVIAGRPKGCEDHWREMQLWMDRCGVRERIIERIEYIADAEVERYFKAAHVLILPYTHVFQSGVLFLGYSFGLPAIVTDVGAMREEVVEGKTGFVCRAGDSIALAATIRTYFASGLFQRLDAYRHDIQAHANERYSWSKVGAMTKSVYEQLTLTGG